MNKFKKSFIYISLPLFLFTGCNKQKEIEIKKTSSYLSVVYDIKGDMVLPLNTDVTIITAEPNKNNSMVNKFSSVVNEYHKLLDSHHDYLDIVNIKTINDSYGKGPVKVDEKIIKILQSAIDISLKTDGLFNPTAGTLSEVWKDRFNNEHKSSDPKKEDVEKAVACTLNKENLTQYLVIDEKNSTVELKKLPTCSTNVKIDLGAYSKGYVLDRAYEALLEYDSPFLLNAGGSSLIAYTPKHLEEKIKWTISLSNPDEPSKAYNILRFNNIFMSTSGDYQQYFINEDGIRRHHIVNPYTGYPENNYRSISLFSNSNAGALDAISTSLYSSKDYNTILDNFDLDIKKLIIKEVDNKLIEDVDIEVKDMIIQ